MLSVTLAIKRLIKAFLFFQILLPRLQMKYTCELTRLITEHVTTRVTSSLLIGDTPTFLCSSHHLITNSLSTCILQVLSCYFSRGVRESWRLL